jgi:hypothetical protein
MKKEIDYSRTFCKPIKEPMFGRVIIEKTTQTTMWEKFCLQFIKKQFIVDEIEGTTLVYKKFNGKLYILQHFVNPPKHWSCRHGFTFTDNKLN